MRLRPVRLPALGLALCLAWSFALAAPAQALATAGPPALAALRRLAVVDGHGLLRSAGSPLRQMSHQAHVIGPYGGEAFAWQAGVNHTNTANGNKLTELPLVSWTARGGLPVDFALVHNSQALTDASLKAPAVPEVGQKWVCSYDIWLVPGGFNRQSDAQPAAAASPQAIGTSEYLTLEMGGREQEVFTLSNGTYVPPAGIHDALTANADGTCTLTRPDQTKYHFTTALACDTISDEDGNTITLARNSNGTLASVTDPTGRAITITDDSSSRIHTVTDPLGRIWILTYNASDELAQVTDPPVGGSTYSTSYAYNADFDVTGVTDPRGYTRALSYNSDDSLAWEQDEAGNQTTYAYTSTTTTVTDPNGHATVYTYDSSGRVVQEQDPAGDSEYDTYDTNNNKTQVEDKRGYYWNYTYDGMGNRLTAKDPYGNTTTCTYNAHNKLLTETLPGGESTANTYDAADNLTVVQQKSASGTVLATTTYTVSAATYGLVTAKQDPDGHTYSYGYDANGDLKTLTTPLGRLTQWACDALGDRTSRTDAMNRTTAYGLDGWERVSTITYPDSSAKGFTYDADGDVTGFTDATGTTARTYDADDRLLSETKGGSTVVSHTYDAAGKLGMLSTTTDAGGRALTYAYTNRNQLASVSEASGTASYGYDADGDETGITNENGTAVTKTYDNADRLGSVTNKSPSGTTLSSFTYSYNADSLRSSVTEADGSVVTYGYDGLLHLSSEVRTGTSPYSASYVVDGAGQRTSETVGGATTTFTYDADAELTGTSGGFANSYGYNANGDQTTRTLAGTSYTLTYDFDDQLTSTGGASYTYDAEGRRVSRTAGGVATAFLYDGDEVLLEKQGSTTTATYTYGTALVRKDGETPLFDGLGSERTVANAAGAVQGSLTMTAFGQAVASTGSSTDPYEFAATSGYRNDGDAGLVLVGARYYDPQARMFISRDTDLGQLPYVYCNGDPVNAVDPSGHFDHNVVGSEVCIVAEAIATCAAIAVATSPPAVIIEVIVGAGAIIGTAIWGSAPPTPGPPGPPGPPGNGPGTLHMTCTPRTVPIAK